MANYTTVSKINAYIKNMFRQDYVLSRVSVKGEISNCKYHTSGHIYFTLKDEGGTLSAIMFASQAKSLAFHLSDGMQVIVSGRIEVYERDGKYQLYANSIVQDGIGDLYKKFEELKKQFQDMGYFESEYKRPIPYFSKKIGIVTASTGAAIHDIMNISYRRNPYVSLVLYPALVQGEGAASSIVSGIETLDTMGMDVIIVGRGGGSIEDLWAFNEECVAEAIFNAKTPIISAVGHETDFTIADFVADLRAPTPSAAAELAVADIHQIENKITGYEELINSAFMKVISQKRTVIDNYSMRLKYLNPLSRINEKRITLDRLKERLDDNMWRFLKNYRHKLEVYASRLHGVSPLEKLGQGYSCTQNENGIPVTSVNNIAVGDLITTTLKDGEIISQIKEVKNNESFNS
ncbi:MAG: exodeoxyribonuclease VII large subunit [Clostridia bacterium]|nr:exodeoxyribonuclease VII large subunit [Clostridia bacterium]